MQFIRKAILQSKHNKIQVNKCLFKCYRSTNRSVNSTEIAYNTSNFIKVIWDEKKNKKLYWNCTLGHPISQGKKHISS